VILMLRLVLLSSLSILSAQAWSHAPPASLVYSYDAVEHLVIDRNIISDTQNQQYDGLPSIRYCCSESLSSNPREQFELLQKIPGDSFRTGAPFR